MRALLPNVVDVLMHGAAGFGWRAGFDGFEHFPVFKAIFIGEDDEIQLALFFELFLKFWIRRIDRSILAIYRTATIGFK